MTEKDRKISESLTRGIKGRRELFLMCVCMYEAIWERRVKGMCVLGFS